MTPRAPRAIDVPGGLLDAVYVGVLGEYAVGVGGYAYAGAAGHIVQDHWNVHPVRHIGEVLHKAFLGALVVIGSDHKDAVGTGAFGVLGVSQRCLGVVAAHAYYELHAPLVEFYGLAYGLILLAQGLGGGLPGGAADHYGRRAVFVLVVDVLLKPVEIHSMLSEGRDDGGA